MKMFFHMIILVFFGYTTCLADINNMVVQGQGDARYLGFIKVYQATLYTKRAQHKQNILDPEISRCLKLDYALALSASDIIEGANTILARQHSPAMLARVQTEINTLHMAYRDVKAKDRYVLCYDSSEKKTTLFLNEEELVSITSADLGTIYFGIWLGPTAPIDDKLRDKLLAYHKHN